MNKNITVCSYRSSPVEFWHNRWDWTLCSHSSSVLLRGRGPAVEARAAFSTVTMNQS